MPESSDILLVSHTGRRSGPIPGPSRRSAKKREKEVRLSFVDPHFELRMGFGNAAVFEGKSVNFGYDTAPKLKKHGQ